MSNIIVHDAGKAIEAARQMYAIVANMSRDVLREGVDYGTIPGTNKPTLLKPGAEKLCWALGLRPEFKAVSIIEDFAKPLFYYRYECNLIHVESGAVVGSGIGSCNSYEDKYGWRWVDESEAPEKHDYMTRSNGVTEFEFGIKESATTGKYGKPAEYWQAFKDAIESGEATEGTRSTKNGNARTWTISKTQVRVPNENIYSIVNTLDKMAQKRALISSVLIAAGASEFFTQDIEDMPGFAEIEAPVITVTPAADDKSEPKAKKNTKQDKPTPKADSPIDPKKLGDVWGRGWVPAHFRDKADFFETVKLLAESDTLTDDMDTSTIAMTIYDYSVLSKIAEKDVKKARENWKEYVIEQVKAGTIDAAMDAKTLMNHLNNDIDFWMP